MSATFTVLGSRGYIGSHLASHLRAALGAVVNMDSSPLPKGNLGHVIYCIGVTTDFAGRLHDTMQAHVGKVMEILHSWEFESFTYLSSTRVYERGSSGDETASLTAEPTSLADYYKISKIAGEALCLTDTRPTVRVARLSNVIGFEEPPLTFVPSLIRDALRHGKIVLNTALDSAKDYIAMEDVLQVLPRLAMHGQERIYNVSSGVQTTHEQIVRCISQVLNSSFEAKQGGTRATFPGTPARRLQAEFNLVPRPIAEILPALCQRYVKFGVGN